MMKKKVFVTSLCLILFIPLFLLVCAFVLPPQYDESYMGELKEKIGLAEETPGKRIIIAGGSAAAFGIDSALIEKEFPAYKVVNGGMYAALGTKAILDLLEPSLRRGDIVILMPEHNEQTLSEYFNAEILWQGMDGAFGLLKRIGREDRGSMLGAFPYFAGRKLYYALHGKPQSGPVYCKGAFNEYGDLAVCREGNVMSGLYDPSMPVILTDEVLSGEFAQYLNAYAARVREKGIRFCYHFAPVNRLAVVKGDADSCFDALQERLTFPLTGDPNQSVMDPEWFYDTNFHLNSAGAVLNTRNLVYDLRALLQDSSPVSITVPEKPRPMGPEYTEGDDSDQALFIYELTENTYAVTGVKEEGRGRERLTVPALYEGLPVTAVRENAFQDAEVKEVVLQENIRFIEDGAFADSGIRRLILTGSDPGTIQCGQDALRDCVADFYVPPQALERYLTHYFWAPYAARIKAQE